MYVDLIVKSYCNAQSFLQRKKIVTRSYSNSRLLASAQPISFREKASSRETGQSPAEATAQNGSPPARASTAVCGDRKRGTEPINGEITWEHLSNRTGLYWPKDMADKSVARMSISEFKDEDDEDADADAAGLRHLLYYSYTTHTALIHTAVRDTHIIYLYCYAYL